MLGFHTDSRGLLETEDVLLSARAHEHKQNNRSSYDIEGKYVHLKLLFSFSQCELFTWRRGINQFLQVIDCSRQALIRTITT